jgi:hypothetical protein
MSTQSTTDIMVNVMAFASVLAVFVLALIQLVKRTVNLPNNVLPLVGVVIGLLIGVVGYPFTTLDLTLRLWAGGLAGLSSTGLFELAFSNRAGSTKDDPSIVSKSTTTRSDVTTISETKDDTSV